MSTRRLDLAVIDRIRGYADDGMSPERIASTLDIPLPDVRRHLVGVSLPAIANQHRTNIGLESAGAPDIKPTSGSTRERKLVVGPLVDLPVRVEPKGTAKQREIWSLVHDEGLTRVEAATRLGAKAPTIRNQLIAYMRANGIVGPIPGESGRTGPVPGTRKAANNIAAVPTAVPTSVAAQGEETAPEAASPAPVPSSSGSAGAGDAAWSVSPAEIAIGLLDGEVDRVRKEIVFLDAVAAAIEARRSALQAVLANLEPTRDAYAHLVETERGAA